MCACVCVCVCVCVCGERGKRLTTNYTSIDSREGNVYHGLDMDPSGKPFGLDSLDVLPQWFS